MRINNINNQNFNGYKNVLSYQLDEGNGNNFTYMAMQLDNSGQKDLDIWKEIQKELFFADKQKDIIVFKILSEQGRQNLFVDKYNIQINSFKKSSKGEKLTLKALSLISSLTNRIKNESFPPGDSKIYLTLVELYRDLTYFFNNGEIASKLSNLAVFEKAKHDICAETINRQIQQKMSKYFKL